MTPACTPDSYGRWFLSERHVASRAAKARVIARICGDRIAASRRVVDLGCGTGLIKEELSRLLGRVIVGVEISREILHTRHAVAVADVLALPFPDGSFDFAICNHVYEHVSDQARFFREVRRVLTPAGQVYLSAGSRYALIEPHYRLPLLSWLPPGLSDRYVRMTGRAPAYRDIRLLGRRSLHRLLGQAGFGIEDVTVDAVLENRETFSSPLHRAILRLLAVVPRPILRLAAMASPQWFLLLHVRGDRDAHG